MKITSFCVTVLLFLSALNANAKIFYVLNGDQFKLKPEIGSFHQYKWLDQAGDPISLLAGETIGSDGLLTKTFTLTTATVAETKYISLGVLDIAGGCLSNLIQHTIIVLPKLTLAVVPLIDNFCENLAEITTEITAALPTSLPDLTAYGVTLGSTYKWFKDGILIPDAAGNKITVTEIGVYKSEVAYILPIVGDYIPNGSKIADAIIGSTTIQKGKPAPTTPDIDIL